MNTTIIVANLLAFCFLLAAVFVFLDEDNVEPFCPVDLSDIEE